MAELETMGLIYSPHISSGRLPTEKGLRLYVDNLMGIQTKFNSIDFATETDRECEKIIFDKLKKIFPNHKLIGEESTAAHGGGIELTNEPTWVVDPIDGTTNFVHSFGFTCTSIAFVVNKIPIIGIVYCPFTDELFIAVKGKGSYCNGVTLESSKIRSLNEALVLTEFGYSRDISDIDKWFHCAKNVLKTNCHALRAMGSGVLDLCYIAAGRLDAVYAGVSGEGWKIWDYSAGILIIEEAGGTMVGVDGKNFDLLGKSVLATGTKELAEELVEVLKK